ncbi:GNAT family N-acetyltransferase [Streptomyces sp. ID05-04B]|uniref:GNAT family N-acetyltransferase n=1 Tax=Streptomyces sp. ID05-04B TaxID=3028661 RepID=UPI0029C217DA|nr:GNAT family N-acetyltransferase [Streptomyces sp. ID05-04B]MDX5568044.1 GNAT family N-acetyltransferase [Streptomyces sp. ID05-04B]
MSAWSTRDARADDLPGLSRLLAETCDPAGVPPSAVLAESITGGLVRVAESDGEVVGCVAAERPSPGHVRLSAAAVRDDLRRQGIALRLLDELSLRISERVGPAPLVSAVIEISDVPLSALLLKSGFIGTRVMRTSRHVDGVCLHYQHKRRVEYIDPDTRYLVPLSAQAQLIESLGSQDQAVTALVSLRGAPALEITRFEQDDPATLQSGEAAAGIAFSGAILAAITFLLGFAFTSTRFPDDVRLLLIGATFSTVLSLIVYASASGELARIHSNTFGKIMKYGNVLSEFGGVLPFLISLPVTYAQASGDPRTTMVLAALLSGGIAWYERSEFSIAHRFRKSIVEIVLMAFTAASPLIGAAVVATGTTSWPWTAALACALSARTWLYLYRRGPEAGTAGRRQWQVRE